MVGSRRSELRFWMCYSHTAMQSDAMQCNVVVVHRRGDPLAVIICYMIIHPHPFPCSSFFFPLVSCMSCLAPFAPVSAAGGR